MACYPCIHCGKCDVFSARAMLICGDCGTELVPGRVGCPKCGSTKIVPVKLPDAKPVPIHPEG